MSLYDTVYISSYKLPVRDDEIKMFGNNPNWQTKSLDCMLSYVFITDDDFIQICNDDFLEFTEYVQINKLDYTGVLNFYGSFDTKWYEFYAKFINGKMINITGGRTYTI